MKLNNRGSWSLIALLVVAAIIIIAAAFYFGQGGTTGPVTVKKDSKLLDSKSKKETVFGQSLDTAKAADCSERLRQITMGIRSWKASEGTEANPKSLRDLGLGVGADYFKCPVSGKDYTYDPATGVVKCPTHSNF